MDAIRKKLEPGASARKLKWAVNRAVPCCKHLLYLSLSTIFRRKAGSSLTGFKLSIPEQSKFPHVSTFICWGPFKWDIHNLPKIKS